MIESENTSGLFPIRTVSDVTGVNSVTLRAWERRYGLIKPHRTAKGHRLYSQGDIATIKQILQLIDEGIPISRVRAVVQQTQNSEPAPRDTQDTWRPYIEATIEAISQFNETSIERIYNEVLSLYPVDTVTRELILPLLRRLGERWQSKQGGIAEEHFFAVYLRNKLGARFHHRQQHNTGPKLIAACLPGEQHEVGLLLFSLAAHERGFQIILLGGNMPLTELPLVAQKTKADAIVLSASIPLESPEVFDNLARLARDTAIPVFVGGRTVSQYSAALQDINIIPAGEDLQTGLKTIRKTLSKI